MGTERSAHKKEEIVLRKYLQYFNRPSKESQLQSEAGFIISSKKDLGREEWIHAGIRLPAFLPHPISM